MLRTVSAILLLIIAAWFYQAIQPEPPKICGSIDGPPVTSPRIKLKDGRHISYLETGVPKEKANHKIIFLHGFSTCKYHVIPVSPALLEELGVYLLSFDRPGYGESDPQPKISEKSTASDIEELADQLQLGSRFYVIGYSMGGELVWSCLKYIPHRLAGAAMLAPVSNYWWPSFPANISKAAYNQQIVQDQWAVRVAHYAPWLAYWWNTQKWFPSSSVITFSIKIFSNPDKMLLHKLAGDPYQPLIRQQGEYASLHHDLKVSFGRWEFDPMELDNPLSENAGPVHLWHGSEDLVVPVMLSRYISEKLPWIKYHEVPEGGHLFAIADGIGDKVVKALLKDA